VASARRTRTQRRLLRAAIALAAAAALCAVLRLALGGATAPPPLARVARLLGVCAAAALALRFCCRWALLERSALAKAATVCAQWSRDGRFTYRARLREVPRPVLPPSQTTAIGTRILVPSLAAAGR